MAGKKTEKLNGPAQCGQSNAPRASDAIRHGSGMAKTVPTTHPHAHADSVILAQAQGVGLLNTYAGWRQVHALPVGLFGSAAALTMLSVAWRLDHDLYDTPIWIAEILMAAAVLAFSCLAIGYLVKLIAAPGAVWTEFCDPITGPLFGLVPIGLLLLPIVLAPFFPLLAKTLWASGTAGIVVIAWLSASRLLDGSWNNVHASPTWIIPAIGLLDIPLAMQALNLPPMHGVAAFGFGVGLFYTMLVIAVLSRRMVFGPPLSRALEPSALVLIAPLATGFVAYFSMMHVADLFSKSLYLTMDFLLAVLLPRLRQLRECCPLTVSWWAVGFPLAMACLPALHFAKTEPRLNSQVIAFALLSIATMTCAVLVCQTISRLVQGELATTALGSAPRSAAE